MVAWETMALASFFLVTTEHRIPEIRRAGFLYLLIAHVGAIAILLCFGVLQGGSGDYTFGAMRAVIAAGRVADASRSSSRSSGFGAKAGLLPLHVWLPEAHPAAPSPVSALMSGVMLKTAIYGLLRVDVRPARTRSSGGGAWSRWRSALSTALFGVIFAAVQTDMKRLLAYSSIENIGIIVAGIGLAILFKAYDKTLLAAIALTAVLYHCAQPRVLQEPAVPRHRLGAARDARAQPRQARRPHPPDAVGRVARAGRHAGDRRPAAAQRLRFRMAAAAGVPVHADACRSRSSTCWCRSPPAALVLAAALAAYVMVKFYGVVFLGRPREPNLAYAQDAGRFERVALVWLARRLRRCSACFPVNVIALHRPRQRAC